MGMRRMRSLHSSLLHERHDGVRASSQLLAATPVFVPSTSAGEYPASATRGEVPAVPRDAWQHISLDHLRPEGWWDFDRRLGRLLVSVAGGEAKTVIVSRRLAEHFEPTAWSIYL